MFPHLPAFLYYDVHKTMKLNIDNAKKSSGRPPVELEAVNVRLYAARTQRLSRL